MVALVQQFVILGAAVHALGGFRFVLIHSGNSVSKRSSVARLLACVAVCWMVPVLYDLCCNPDVVVSDGKVFSRLCPTAKAPCKDVCTVYSTHIAALGCQC